MPGQSCCSMRAAGPVPARCWSSSAPILRSPSSTTTRTHGPRRSTTVIEDRYDPQEFYSAVAGLENEPERGSRCTVCYRLRMRRAAQYAAEHGFQWFTTTLSISPHKDAKRINEIGQELEAEFGVKHLPSDFKKHNGYLRSLQLSEEYGLYRQDYCGCEFSAKARGIEE